MSNAVDNFLASRLPIAGVAAYCVQMADRVVAAQCFSKSLYASTTERMLLGVVLSCRTLLPASERSARYCWIFESLHVYVAARADGLSLALLVEDTLATELAQVRETVQAFLEIPEL